MLNKLEKKLGKYAIRNLSYYILIIAVIGSVIGIFMPQIFINYLSLDFDKIFHGQVWRLITFILYPQITSISPTSLLFGALSLFLYYFVGKVLEENWGTFRFNVYYISGIIFNILGSLILYLIFGVSLSYGMTYINYALFLAFASIAPEHKIMLFMIIPVKMKYLGYLYIFLIGYEVVTSILSFSVAGTAVAVSIIISVLNYIIYYLSTRKVKRKPHIAKTPQKPKKIIITKDNKCAICGKIKEEHPNLEFRYCSKCSDGQLYCEEHLFTHEHK